MQQLENSIKENKDGTLNTLLQEIALKLMSDDDNEPNEYQNFREEILLKLQRMFKEKDRDKIEYVLNLFVKKQDAKETMNSLSDMLFRYIEKNTRIHKALRDKQPKEESKEEPEASEFARVCLDSQAKEIIESIRSSIQKYLKYTNMYKVYKIHTGIKRLKTDEEFEDFTGDLRKDAK
eukprot:CAMPEP_0197008612 /NCGR_PEP_ID=MMETSP1380-20130617/46068_1 /TAXON_ID=5936 /ORGANISM="Euplotes crassus, Strain CT5" /LENGTH=177 /DNA_ID=CAMNT_0042429301 /DNA_START=15 /DNA_END=548 /DNA_ORIENTATION=+